MRRNQILLQVAAILLPVLLHLMVVTVIKIESRSFSRTEIQQFNTDNRRIINREYLYDLCTI
jgi:hypothetical protein